MALFSTFLFFYLRHVYPKTEYSQGLYFSSKTTVLDLTKIFSSFRSKIYHWYVPIDIYHIWFLSGPCVSYPLELMNKLYDLFLKKELSLLTVIFRGQSLEHRPLRTVER